MLNVEFEAATCSYLDALQGYLLYLSQIETLEQAVGMQLFPLGITFPFDMFEGAAAAKAAYVEAFTASLAEINGFQGVGIAHYNPTYLAHAQTFLATVSIDGAENGAVSAGQIADAANFYGNLYNDGLWPNYLVALREREVHGYRRGYFNATVALLQKNTLSLGPSPIPDSTVFAYTGPSCGMILNQATTRSGAVMALSIRLFQPMSPPGSVQVAVYSKNGDVFTLIEISEVPVDFSNTDEQLVPLATQIPISAGQYVGIRNNGDQNLNLNWTDGPDNHVWWPSLSDTVGTSITLEQPGTPMAYCGWSVVF